MAEATAEAKKPQVKVGADEKVSSAPMMERIQVPMEVSKAVKDEIRKRTIFRVSELYVDRPVSEHGFGSFAADGREFYGVDIGVVRSLMAFHDDYKGIAFGTLEDSRVTIAGTDEKPIIFYLDGRQRLKACDFINENMARIWKLHVSMIPAEGFKDGKAKKEHLRALIGEICKRAELGRNGSEECKDWAWINAEDAERLVGGKLRGESVRGLLFKGAETDDGPMEFGVRVSFDNQVDVNDPKALAISIAKRISVETSPMTRVRQMAQLAEAGYSITEIALLFKAKKNDVIENHLLMLKLIPEVQQAFDLPALGLTLKDCVGTKSQPGIFVVESKKGRVAKAPEEQRNLLERYLTAHGDKSAVKAVKQEGKKADLPEGFKCGHEDCAAVLSGDVISRLPPSDAFPYGAVKHVNGCKAPGGGHKTALPKPETPVVNPNLSPGAKVVSPGGATTGSPVAGTPPVAPATPKAPRSKSVSNDPTVRALPRAAKIAYAKTEALPAPDPESGIESYYSAKMERQWRASIARMMAFVGGDGSAFDDHPEEKTFVLDTIAEAQVVEQEETAKKVQEDLVAKGQTPVQQIASKAAGAFNVWEDEDSDTRGEWPVSDDDVTQALIDKVASEYQAGVDSKSQIFIEEFLGKKVDFALDFLEKWMAGQEPA